MSEKKLYACIGCQQIHYDGDYSREDGDILIINHKEFFESIDRVKKELGIEGEK